MTTEVEAGNVLSKKRPKNRALMFAFVGIIVIGGVLAFQGIAKWIAKNKAESEFLTSVSHIRKLSSEPLPSIPDPIHQLEFLEARMGAIDYVKSTAQPLPADRNKRIMENVEKAKQRLHSIVLIKDEKKMMSELNRVLGDLADALSK